MSYAIQSTSSEIVVSLRDELTIAHVAGLREELLAALRGALAVVVDAGEAKCLDMSIVQLLHSVRKTVGTLTLRACSTEVRDYLARSGISLDQLTGEPSGQDIPMKGECNG